MKKLFLLLLLPALQTTAQDLTGVWRGTFYSTKQESLFGSDNKYEVQIDNAGKICKGITYSYQNTSFYGKATMVGMWSAETKNLIFSEDKLLEYKTEEGDNTDVYMFTCYLQYRKEGNREILEGDYSSVKYKSKPEKDGGNGKIHLERVVNSEFKKEDFIIKKENEKTKPPTKEAIKKTTAPIKNATTTKKATITPTQKPKPVIAKATAPNKPKVPVKVAPKKTVVPPAVKEEPKKEIVKSEPIKKPETVKPADLPRVLKERKNELVQTILTPGPDISIELYDNGEIDGDTISVFQNGKLIASRRGLSTNPITLKLRIDEDNPDHEIAMVAENLGTIPPNTALMIIKTGGNRYDLRISSSEQKNAVVKFKFQKE
jgi:hypothetical protein